MPNDSLHLEIYGHPVEVLGPETVLDSVREKFDLFAAAPVTRPGTRIFIRLSPPVRPGLRASRVFGTGTYRVYRFGPGFRLVIYRYGASCCCDFGKGTFVLNSQDPGTLKELAYLLILSRFGEYLDRRGIHRLHAAALSLNGRTIAVSGAPGAGKTTLLLDLLKTDLSARLVSDDVALADSGLNLYPLPLRISLAEGDAGPLLKSGEKIARGDGKIKYSADKNAFRAEKEVKKLEILVFAEKSARASMERISGPRSFFKLWLPMVVGYGVPQMAEFMLRLNLKDISGLVAVAFSRLFTAFRISARAESFLYRRGPDAGENEALISNFLKRHIVSRSRRG